MGGMCEISGQMKFKPSLRQRLSAVVGGYKMHSLLCLQRRKTNVVTVMYKYDPLTLSQTSPGFYVSAVQVF